MNKAFDNDRGGRKQWIAWLEEIMQECLRVMKPGAHGLVWALPRTSHWTMTALEDAGFEVRDIVHSIFATGMPKGINVSKAIDKQLGAEREKVKIPFGTSGAAMLRFGGQNSRPYQKAATEAGFHELDGDTSVTDKAKEWEGWNSSIKPAVEYWILVRKPLQEKTIASQVLATGTGALNINACRIPGVSWGSHDSRTSNAIYGGGKGTDLSASEYNPLGRWPAHLVLSHAEGCTLTGTKKVAASVGFTDYDGAKTVNSYGKYIDASRPKRGDENGKEDVEEWNCIEGCPVSTLDKQGGVRTSGTGALKKNTGAGYSPNAYGKESRPLGTPNVEYGDSGGASRYFTQLPYETIPRFIYIPKASPADRTMKKLVKNTHPTTKSTHLMAWLNKLITPPGGVILDPFCGGGSTLIAAKRQGFHYIGIEMNEEYAAIARQRLATLDEV